MDLADRRSLPWIIGCAVFASALLVFLPALQNEFVNLDDNQYIISTLGFQGLGWKQLSWCFTTTLSGQYFPMVWLSFMLDFALWGMDPFGFHLTNLVLHAASTVVLFLVSMQLLGRALPRARKRGVFGLAAAAGVAALAWGIHPLRVESVVWAFERKDVLSGLFYVATFLFYLKAHEPRAKRGRWLSLSVAAAALALLSKASAVTIPAALVILDVYPLRRLPGGRGRWLSAKARAVWVEKAPFALLSLASTVVTLWVQFDWGNVPLLRDQGLLSRAAQSFYGLMFYIWKTLVPTGLVPLYEYPGDFNPLDWPYILCATLVVLITAVLIAKRRKWPALPAVWAFYGVTLLPMLGVIRCGDYLVADRYSYFACMGWAVLAGVAWLGAGRLSREGRGAALAAGAAAFVCLGALSWKQSAHWYDSRSIWEYTLRVEPRHAVAHFGIGRLLQQDGKIEEALARYKEALRRDPYLFRTHTVIGEMLMKLGRPDEAAGHFGHILSVDPENVQGHYGMGDSLLMMGRTAEARKHYHTALRKASRTGQIMVVALDAAVKSVRKERARETIERLREKLRESPKDADAHFELGITLAWQGDLDEAASHYRKVIELVPRAAEAHTNLGGVLLNQGKPEAAVRHFRDSLKISPWNTSAHYNLASALLLLGNDERALSHFKRAMLVNPRHIGARRSFEILRLKMELAGRAS